MNDSRNELTADDARHTARICVPVRPRRASEIAEAVARASREADLVEIRFDHLDPAELEAAPAHVAPLLDSPATLVFTLRPREQGGARESADDEREHFWRRLAREMRRHADASGANPEHERGRLRHYADLELDGGPSAETCAGLARVCRIIRSHHDFAGGAQDLTRLYERLAATDADALKLAVTARDATDCVPVFRLLERARTERRKLVAVAMGRAGVATRVLGPSRGAPFTYAALDAENTTAPGQLTSQELRDLYRLDSTDSRTLVNGLVGSPVTHSLSPVMHNRAFAARGLNAVYLPFEVTDLEAFVRRMVRPATRELEWNLRGLSVTAPHKTAVMSLLDRTTGRARLVGAVNTVTVESDGTLAGDNTDAEAFAAPLRDSSWPRELTALRGARVALLGAGGAARAAAWALRERGARVTVFARDLGRALSLASDFDADAAPLEGASLGRFDLVVNATPLGTRGPLEESTPADAEQLRGARLAYDLVYNPTDTLFMREARAAGCETLGGLAMLVAQGEEQFRLWTGEDAPAGVMRRAAEEALK
ncbi:MAG TPA: shikimate dehydrogenase [Pyrinomonadaceae bacterium]|nr:shikimate dehydrogenase [Pyrinomonadaceae bacterium]